MPVVPSTRRPCSLRRLPERLSGYRGGAVADPLRAMEGAPLALGDKNVARLCQSIDQLAEIFGKAARRCGEGLIDRLPQGVFEILGEAYIHENDGRPCFAEGVRERAAGLRDPVCRVWL